MSLVKQNERLHGIDALRAIAMLLGIFLHASIAYKTIPLPNWPHDPKNNYIILDFFYEFIHSFRMPLFYVIAGYFSGLVLKKSGTFIFIKKRWERIGVPFIVSLFTILPFSVFPFLFYYQAQLNPENVEIALRNSVKSLLGWNGLVHLWFLYYLLIYYGIILIVEKLNLIRNFSQKISSGMFLFFLIFFTFIILLYEKELYIQADTGFFPEIRYIIYYLLFFLSGYFIYLRQTIFEHLKEWSWILLSISISFFLFLFYIELFHSVWYHSGLEHYLIKLLTSIQIILLVAGIIGFFLRFFPRENIFWKYISDASYWMYLIHMGLVAGMQVFLGYTSFPGWLRFPIILLVTFTISLITYHLFVRYTVIGKYLHGYRKKY